MTPRNDLPEMPGLEPVGRGIYLRPNQPYELKRVLFQRGQHRACFASDTEQMYCLPQGYEVDDSPPIPADQALNQIMIEESWDRFGKQLTFDASMAVGTGSFSINASFSQSKQMRSDEEAYYALRTSFIPLWSIYLSENDLLTEELEAADIPVPFKHSHRKKYDRFFERFGSHYVKRAWVGGKAMLSFTVDKSTAMTKEEIQAGIKASLGTTGSGEAEKRLQENKEKLRSNSKCSVFGRGGDELKLAALSTLDEKLYNEWMATIRANPQTIELDVVGIWTLIKDDDKAMALMDAYRAATTFTSISAVFGIDTTIYCVRGRRYFCYDIDKNESQKPKLLVERWPKLAQLGFERFDASFRGNHLVDARSRSLARKLFYFRNSEYICIDVDKDEIEGGYPKLIAEGWPGVPFERIDAALPIGRNTIYFFTGNKYVRFNTLSHGVEDEYPDTISKRWVGVTFDRIDAAIYWGNGKVYFFKEDQHIRYDMVTCRADSGYPKQIIGNYVEDWKFFD